MNYKIIAIEQADNGYFVRGDIQKVYPTLDLLAEDLYYLFGLTSPKKMPGKSLKEILNIPRRGRGRPRKNPLPVEVKRGPGRPRKNTAPIITLFKNDRLSKVRGRKRGRPANR